MTKTIIIIGDGMADEPLEALGGRTPLMAAEKPAIDWIAREGRMGLARTIPATGPADSAVANLAVLGYDPLKTSQGRAVLEAASMGIEIQPDDVALRCNLVSLAGTEPDLTIKNHSAGHISTEEASELIHALDAELGGGRGIHPVRFCPGISYRHLLVLSEGWASPAVACAPPHDHLDEPIAALRPHTTAPEGATTAARLIELEDASRGILRAHPINARRRAAGRDEANSIWMWSPGRRPAMETLHERFGIRAAVISAVDLIMGLGVYAGMDVIRVPGATGLHDTNYEGKAASALDALRDHDLVYVHVEATDEASHARDLALKIRCIEYLDARLVKPILAGLAARDLAVTVAILPDHPTPVTTGQHGRAPVPVAIHTPGVEPDATERYDEAQAERGSLGLLEGDAFIRTVLAEGP